MTNGTVQTAGVTGEAGEAERNQRVARASDLMELKALGTSKDALVSVEEDIESDKKC